MTGEARHAAVDAPDTWVVCLCAGWCGVCREWQPQYERLARTHPGTGFAWIDIEDEADAMGEVDVETFPTLLVAAGDAVRFFGALPPSAEQVARLLERLEAPSASVPPEAKALWPRLKARLGPRPRA